MRIGRTLPPAAAPLSLKDLAGAFTGMVRPARAIRARERELRRHFGVDHVFLVSSGAAALTLVLRAMKSGSDRRRVVVPAYTCYSVPAAVLAAGLEPVLCDINPATFDFDQAALERVLTADTLCVVVQHLFGIVADVDRLQSSCRPRGILVVEDAAQAMGLASRGRYLGTLGDAGIFSLGRGKQITCGNGGIIVTRADGFAKAIASECRRLRPPSLLRSIAELAEVALMGVFIRPSLYWMPASVPLLRLGETIFPKRIPLEPLSGIKAGLMRGWRDRLAASHRVRANTASDLRRRLVRQVKAPRVARSHSGPYLRFPIFAATVQDKERLYEISRERGLGVGRGYPGPISEIPEIKPLVGGQRFPAATYVADHILTLPTHHWLSEEDRRAIADALVPGREIPHRLPPDLSFAIRGNTR